MCWAKQARGAQEPSSTARLSRHWSATSPAGSATRAELLEALRGRITAHHRFMLRLHLEHVDTLDKSHRADRRKVGLVRRFDKPPDSARCPGARSVPTWSWPRSASTCRLRHPGHLLSWACLCPPNDERGFRRSTRLRRGKVAQDHAGADRLGRHQVRAATCRRSSTACAPGAVPRRPSSAWPPPCSPPPGTCFAMAPGGTTSARPFVHRRHQNRQPSDPRAPADRLQGRRLTLARLDVSFQCLCAAPWCAWASWPWTCWCSWSCPGL